MTSSLRIKVFLTPAARDDLERLNRAAIKNPGGRQEALLEATIVMLHRLNGRRHPTKPLDHDPRFADLSDCETTYVGADPYEKPPLRIVSRDIRPEQPDGIIRREIVAIGPRQDSKVYRIAGQRLGRAVGLTLDELATKSEHNPYRSSSRPRQPVGVSESPAAQSDLEFD